MRNFTILIMTVFVAGLMFPAQATAALEPDTHTGFYIGLGIGVGSVTVKVDDSESDAETSGVGQLRMGGGGQPEGSPWGGDKHLDQEVRLAH